MRLNTTNNSELIITFVSTEDFLPFINFYEVTTLKWQKSAFFRCVACHQAETLSWNSVHWTEHWPQKQLSLFPTSKTTKWRYEVNQHQSWANRYVADLVGRFFKKCVSVHFFRNILWSAKKMNALEESFNIFNLVWIIDTLLYAYC